MKAIMYVCLILCLFNVVGCAGGGKFINTRGVLDESLYYIEKDTSNASYEISSSSYGSGKEKATQVPQPALVDQNSTIQILIAKGNLKQSTPTGQFSKQLDELLMRKTSMVKALQLLENVVKSRQKVIETYQQKNLTEFYQAKKDAAKVELALISNLRPLWPNDSKEYSLLEDSYDPPSFGQLQTFLNKQITSIEETNREIETELKSRGRTLELMAFLNSRDKEPIAVHLDGYDSLKEENLFRRDRFGLDLSKEEREKLDAHVEATQKMSAALERLRSGEAKLNETVLQLQSMMDPQIAALLDEGDRLKRRLEPAKLAKRLDESKGLLDAYFLMIQQKNSALYESKKKDFERDKDAVIAEIIPEAGTFLKSVRDWEVVANALRQDWQKATPATMTKLITNTVDAVKTFEALRKQLPVIAANVPAKAVEVVERFVKDIDKTERDIFLKSDEAQAIRSNLEEYYRDFQDISNLMANAAASLSRMEQQPIAEMPSATVSFQVPIDDIKDTFINLEATPRLTGDFVTVKATLKEGGTVVDTSVARFQVNRYGHYAELSPAVVLIKPDQLQGGDDGFRFAPVLSWMHHWSPRPQITGNTASVFRALDPALGIHSAFTNFRSDSSKDTVQIGLGMTFSLWTNRLQVGAGYNLMAESKKDGQYYFFIGSDLIGLLQTVGIVKQ